MQEATWVATELLLLKTLLGPDRFEELFKQTQEQSITKQAVVSETFCYDEIHKVSQPYIMPQ
jgi:hypothetical protein